MCCRRQECTIIKLGHYQDCFSHTTINKQLKSQKMKYIAFVLFMMASFTMSAQTSQPSYDQPRPLTLEELQAQREREAKIRAYREAKYKEKQAKKTAKKELKLEKKEMKKKEKAVGKKPKK